MKIFDMHVHVFPDAVAHKAVDNLADYYHVKMASGGTLADFEQSVRETPDIKKCLIHSTATTAHQVESVNNFVASLINDDILGFGSMHPDYGDIAGEMDRMISLGLRGIKLHTDFQRFNADSDEACKIYECAEAATASGRKAKNILSEQMCISILQAFCSRYQKSRLSEL